MNKTLVSHTKDNNLRRLERHKLIQDSHLFGIPTDLFVFIPIQEKVAYIKYNQKRTIFRHESDFLK